MKLSICLTPSQPWADVLRVAEHTERRGWEGVAPGGARQHCGGCRPRERGTSRTRHRRRVAGERARRLWHPLRFDRTTARDPRELRRSTQALLVLRAPGLPRRPFPSRLPVMEGSVEQLRDTFGRYAAAGVDEYVLTSEVLPVLR